MPLVLAGYVLYSVNRPGQENEALGELLVTEIASDDFPGDGIRWIRRQVGMDTVIVNGAVTWTAAQGYIAGARAGTIATL